MTISINIRNFPKKAIMFIIFTEITEIIENVPNISDADIADTNDVNVILENIENALFKNITVESAPIRRSIRHRKAIFKIMEVNVMAANIMGIAEAFIISANKEESEKENYLPKIIIAKLFIVNENKLTYEEAMTDSEKFQ
jgi:hypothetical protein